MTDDVNRDNDGFQGPVIPPDSWELTVENRLRSMKLMIYVDGGVAIAAFALGMVTFTAVNNLTKGVQEIAKLVNGTASVVFANPVTGDVSKRAPYGTDETTEPPNNVVSDPATGGPMGHSPDDVNTLASDDGTLPYEIVRDEVPRQ